MAYWMFQGNPKAFDVSTYLIENEIITWDVRQKQYLDEIKSGDNAFIWRSDGGKKNTGGIIALCEIISEPYLRTDEDRHEVKLRVKEYRLAPEDGMLLRHELREIPEGMNLQILKMSQGTNYRLERAEYERLLKLWEEPESVKGKLELPLLDKYLLVYKEDVNEWLKESDFLEENYNFFSTFKQKEHLEKLEWEDIQKLGNHINAFRMALARKRALGFMNGTLEKYRNSFLYLIHGDEPLEYRIEQFTSNDEYKLFGFGESVVSEMIGNIFPESYCFYNQRDKVAVENVLQLKPKYTRGDRFSAKFIKFQQCLVDHNVVEKYESIVGKHTDLPVYLEIDQFFSYLFEKFSKVEIEEAMEVQYWLLAAGENSNMWKDFEENSHIAIGWSELGDLLQYNNKREIAEALRDLRGIEHNPNNDALANYEFAYEMREGDYVFIKKGNHSILALGKVTSDYAFDKSRENYQSVRNVEWLKLGDWKVEAHKLHTKTLTNVTQYQDFVEDLLNLVGKDETTPYDPIDKGNHIVKDKTVPYTTEQLLQEVFVSPEKLDEIIETIEFKKNVILQGPPGVGKTFVAKRLTYAHNTAKDDSKIAMIQFHQSYSYEDFIRGYKPSKDGTFKLKDGIFYEFCKKALADPENNYYMIIDEINRGNLSKIFGEVMMLIETDKRGSNYAVQLTYSEEANEKFYIPKNVFLIGTMNTADRSLALVDYALRRRFAFINLEPAFNEPQFREYLIAKGISQGFIDKIITTINDVNQEIINDKVNLGKGYEIGHSYFCPTIEKISDEEKWFDRIIKLEIEPLLREYWFDSEEKVSDLLARLQ